MVGGETGVPVFVACLPQMVCACLNPTAVLDPVINPNVLNGLLAILSESGLTVSSLQHLTTETVALVKFHVFFP